MTNNNNNEWPVLSYKNGKETYETLQLWTQIVGKIKLEALPWVNHSWHITLHITPTGLTTQTIPYQNTYFQIDFDFVNHELRVSKSDGSVRQFSLKHISVADFYDKIFAILGEMGIHIVIKTMPSEVFGDVIPLDSDHKHVTYDENQAAAFHKALLNIQQVFMIYRSGFTGKSSPVHFFWGTFDLALAFFSGRKAPRHPGKLPHLPDKVLQDAFSHEVNDCGFWTGSEAFPEAAFYCYLYPEPAGYQTAKVSPAEAFYSLPMGEFILPYAAVQRAENPKAKLLDFLKSTYAIGSGLAKWDNGLWKQEE
ncbi:DUF5996 family protein [Mucilaginibacter gynuensis]|uniref:DUF5996 family protein n=1 Tax=Mucilaginibacter gynuensis TaxID=1302236 RepID=A0ABP8GGC8_9SPHI